MLYLARDMLCASNLSWLRGFCEEACPEALGHIDAAIRAEQELRDRLYDLLGGAYARRGDIGDLVRIDGQLHMVVEATWQGEIRLEPLAAVLARTLLTSDEGGLRLDEAMTRAGWVPPLEPPYGQGTVDEAIRIALTGTVDDNLIGEVAEVLAHEVQRLRAERG